MKRILGLGLLMLMLIPSAVSAVTFEHDGVSYVLEEAGYNCPLNETTMFIKKVKDFYVFGDRNAGDLYKVDTNNVCSLLRGQDYLDYYFSGEYYIDLSNNKIYKYLINEPSQEYIKTEDTILNNEKQYYIIETNSHNSPKFSTTDSPTEDNLNTYYEKAYFTSPVSAKLDNSITYYKLVYGDNSIPTYLEKVENPVEKDVAEYSVKYTGSIKGPELLATINQTIYDNVNNQNNYISIYGDEGKLFIVGKDDSIEPTVSHTYDLNGNLINSLENAKMISIVGKDLLLVSYINGTIKIMTYDYEVIYTFEGYNRAISVETIGNINYIDAAETEEYTSPMTLFYLKTYKENNGTTHNFNNNDLTFTFSGDLAKLSKVKINNVELSTNNYIKESGSTIITLKKSYLETLKKGNYTLKVEYNDGGYSSASFTIPEENPQTFDDIMNYVLFGGISIIGIVGCIIYFKKKESYSI